MMFLVACFLCALHNMLIVLDNVFFIAGSILYTLQSSTRINKKNLQVARCILQPIPVLLPYLLILFGLVPKCP